MTSKFANPKCKTCGGEGEFHAGIDQTFSCPCVTLGQNAAKREARRAQAEQSNLPMKAVLTDVGVEQAIEFGEHTRLRIQTGPGYLDYIEIGVSRSFHGRHPCVEVRGGGSLIIEPHVSNVVQVRTA